MSVTGYSPWWFPPFTIFTFSEALFCSVLEPCIFQTTALEPCTTLGPASWARNVRKNSLHKRNQGSLSLEELLRNKESGSEVNNILKLSSTFCSLGCNSPTRGTSLYPNYFNSTAKPRLVKYGRLKQELSQACSHLKSPCIRPSR